MSLWVMPEDFELARGELSFWTTVGDSGAPKVCAFCGRCGSRIYHATGDAAAPLSIKAGTLDDPSWLRPVAQLWTRRAHAWLSIDEIQCCAFDGEPDSDEALITAWRKVGGA